MDAVDGVSDEGQTLVFATTHWSVVLTAQGESAAAHQALERLCRTYWRPLYAFVRRQGHSTGEAEDLTQGFFVRLLERKDFDVVRREKGRLRSYLLVSLKHFLANERDRTMAVKRGEGRRPIPLHELQSCEGSSQEPLDTWSPDRIYERRWALTVLEQVFARLKTEYNAVAKAPFFDRLKQLLTGESGAPSQVELAAELGMNANALKQALHRFRQRYRILLREEIAHTVAVPGDIDDELRHLVAVLRD